MTTATEATVCVKMAAREEVSIDAAAASVPSEPESFSSVGEELRRLKARPSSDWLQLHHMFVDGLRLACSLTSAHLDNQDSLLMFLKLCDV